MVDEDSYAVRLREALEREGWSQARLVRELARETGNAPESERSAVRGYLQGAIPRPERAALIARITGVPGLATVENPRGSAAARMERRLEALATEAARIEESHLEIHRKLDQLLDAVQDGFRRRGGDPKRKAQ